MSANHIPIIYHLIHIPRKVFSIYIHYKIFYYYPVKTTFLPVSLISCSRSECEYVNICICQSLV